MLKSATLFWKLRSNNTKSLRSNHIYPVNPQKRSWMLIFLVHNMHFILISNPEIKNGYAYSDRRLKLSLWHSRKSFILSEMWDSEQLSLRRNTKGQLKYFRFQKDLFSQNLKSQDLECEILPEGCLGLMGSWSQNHEWEWLWANTATWKRTTSGFWVENLGECVSPSPKAQSQIMTLGTRVHIWEDLMETWTFYPCVVTYCERFAQRAVYLMEIEDRLIYIRFRISETGRKYLLCWTSWAFVHWHEKYEDKQKDLKALIYKQSCNLFTVAELWGNYLWLHYEKEMTEDHSEGKKVKRM